MTVDEIRKLDDCFRVDGMYNRASRHCSRCPDRFKCSGGKDKTVMPEEKKKKTEKKNKPVRDKDKYSTKPIKNPQTRGDAIRHFANAVLNLSKDLKYYQGKNGISIWTSKHSVLVLSVGGTPTTLRLASSFFSEDEDPGCEKDSKGYPTIVLERPPISEAETAARWALKRAGVNLK